MIFAGNQAHTLETTPGKLAINLKDYKQYDTFISHAYVIDKTGKMTFLKIIEKTIENPLKDITMKTLETRHNLPSVQLAMQERQASAMCYFRPGVKRTVRMIFIGILHSRIFISRNRLKPL